MKLSSTILSMGYRHFETLSSDDSNRCLPTFIFLVLLNHVFPALDDLPTIHPAGGQEIDACLYPQGPVFEGYFVEAGSHAVDAYKTVDSESRREEVREISPELRHCRSRPGNAGKEEQGHGGEYEYQHAGLPVAYGNRGGHGKEDAGGQIRQHEQDQYARLAYLDQTEQARHHAKYIDGYKGVDHEVTQPLAKDNAQRPVIVAVDGHQIPEPVVLACSSGGKPDAEQQGLLDNQHQHGRYQECRETVCRIEKGDILISYRIGSDFILAVGTVAGTLYLNVGIHVQRHACVCIQQGLVVKQSAHVAEQADLSLLPSGDVIAELGRYIDDANDPQRRQEPRVSSRWYR